MNSTKDGVMCGELDGDDVRWKIVTDRARFEQLRTDPRFHAVVALGRTVNALRFVQMPLISHEHDESPAATRAKYNSLFFSCALYSEGYLLVQKLKKHFAEEPLFQVLTEATIKNPKAQEALKWSIVALRNKLVFHFDIDEVGRKLQQVNLDEIIFVSGLGNMNAQVHYELGDHCAWQTLYDPLKAEGDVTQIMSRAEQINDLIVTFSQAAEEFMVDYLNSTGWHRE
jgi:hypothetical protein